MYFIICNFRKGCFCGERKFSPRHRVAASPRRFETIALWFLITLALAACGYHFAGTGGQAPGNINSIAVDNLQNRTAEAGVETIFTNAIINEFIRWKRLEVKPRKEADAVLGGSVARISTSVSSRRAAKTTLTTRVTVTLSLTLTDVDTEEILWQNRSLSYYEEYLQTGDALTTNRLQREAIQRIAVWLAEKIHQDIFEEF
jgi:outer membrane lipopolysaccharide assembly protein LptE/RlpB